MVAREGEKISLRKHNTLIRLRFSFSQSQIIPVIIIIIKSKNVRKKQLAGYSYGLNQSTKESALLSLLKSLSGFSI